MSRGGNFGGHLELARARNLDTPERGILRVGPIADVILSTTGFIGQAAQEIGGTGRQVDGAIGFRMNGDGGDVGGALDF